MILVLDIDDRGLVLRLEHMTEHVPDDGRWCVNRNASVDNHIRAWKNQVTRQRHVRLRRCQADAPREARSRHSASTRNE